MIKFNWSFKMKSPHPFFSGMLALVLMFLMSTAYANESTEQQIAKLQKSARILFKQKKYEKAVNTSAKAFELAREKLSERNSLYISGTHQLGLFLYELGEYEQAQPFYEEVLRITQKHLGTGNLKTLVIMYELGDLYYETTQFSKALSILENTTILMEQHLGKNNKHTLLTRILLAQVYQTKGRPQKAEQHIKTTLARYFENYKPDNIDRIEAEKVMATLYKANGKYNKAEKLYIKILEKQKLLLGRQAPDTLITMGNLAEVYRNSGKYQLAEPLFHKAIKNLETTMGAQSPELYFVMGHLASLYEQKSEFQKAEDLFQKIWRFDQKTLGDKHPNTIIDINNLAGIYRKQGKYALAEKSYKKALEGLIHILGEDHPESISVKNNLALLYENQGIYDKAEPLLKDALKHAKKTLGEKNPKTLAMMNNLALLYESQGVFKQSEPLYNKALLLNREVFGSEHENTIASINNLGYLYLVQQKYDKAEKRFKSVYQTWKKTFGEKNQKTLKALNNLARVYHKQNRLADAEVMFKKALRLRKELLGNEHPDVIRSLIDLSTLYVSQKRYDQAEDSLSQTFELAGHVLGDKHPYTFEVLNNLADLYEIKGNRTKALETRKIGFDNRTAFFERVLWASGENTRQAYITLHKDEQDKYLNLLVQNNNPKSARDALYVSLERKGLILKIASEIHKIVRMSDAPNLSAKAQALNQKRKELSAKTLSGPINETTDKFQQKLVDLENEINDLQAELGRASLEYQVTSQRVRLDEVFDKLKANDVLVDYMAYKDGNIDKVMAIAAKKETESCYLLFNCDEIKLSLVPIGNLSLVNQVVSEYRDTIQDEDAEEEDLLGAGHDTYNLVWKPLEKFFGKRTSIYLVPDSILHLLPFDALIDEDENFLIQNFDIKMLSSVRDIVIPPLPAAKGNFMIFAGPDYNIENVKKVIKSTNGKRSGVDQSLKISSHGLRSLSFEPLEGAEKEGNTIRQVSEEKNTNSAIFTRKTAEEVQLQNIQTAPQMLHIATHGFFLQAEERLKRRLLSIQRGGAHTTPPPGDNPLIRAGLAFAGINSNAPFLGDIDTDNDGVLTALEVLGLQLSGTRLVVLSACETGVGEIHSGEGVYGLRRSFQEAGVTNVVNSLWPVSDEGTRVLMESFYRNIYDGMSPENALRTSQKMMLDSEWNHPYYWSAFVMVIRKQP